MHATGEPCILRLWVLTLSKASASYPERGLLSELRQAAHRIVERSKEPSRGEGDSGVHQEGAGGSPSSRGLRTEGFQIKHVMEWRRALEEHFGVDSSPPKIQLRSLLHYDSPVNAGLLEAWTQKARDPDQAVVDWIKEGAPQQMHPGPWRVPSERRGPASLGRS